MASDEFYVHDALSGGCLGFQLLGTTCPAIANILFCVPFWDSSLSYVSRMGLWVIQVHFSCFLDFSSE